MEKKEIRKKALDLRNAMPEKIRIEKSRQITESIMGLNCYSKAESLLIYRSFGSEVDTYQLIVKAWEEGKQVFCPRVNGKSMDFYHVKNWDDFAGGSYGIQEPLEKCSVFDEEVANSLIIIPGVAFDRKRNRIGYGGGYYDRYLVRYPEIATVAVGFEEQIMEKIPSRPFDIRPQKIVTDRKCYE